MKHCLVCVHDATPAYARETRVMIRDLAPVLGRRLSFGVVPNWHGEWPLAAQPEYCRLLQDASEELLLHGWGSWSCSPGPGPTITTAFDIPPSIDDAPVRELKVMRVAAATHETYRTVRACGWSG